MGQDRHGILYHASSMIYMGGPEMKRPEIKDIARLHFRSDGSTIGMDMGLFEATR